MTNKELKNKIIKTIRGVSLWEDSSGWYGIGKPTAEKLADALIAVGLTFDKTTAVLSERADAKTLTLKAQYYDEMKHRAEVAEKAFSFLYKECAERLGWDIDCTMWYKQQAERGLAREEDKGDK